MSLDFAEILDEDHPFEALAKKTIRTFSTAHTIKRAEAGPNASELRRTGSSTSATGAANRPSAAACSLKKNAGAGYPMINLDGDGIDRGTATTAR